jgi:copper transport protein
MRVVDFTVSAGNLTVESDLPTALTAGTYSVEWKTVGTDGHAAHGTFGFTVTAPAAPQNVGPVAKPVATAPQQQGMSDQIENSGGWFAAAVRFLSFAATVALIGAVAFVRLILARAHFPSVQADEIRRRCAQLGAASATILVVALLARMLLQSRSVGGNVSAAGVSNIGIVIQTHWGAAVAVQLIAGVIALIGCLFARSSRMFGWMVAGVAVVVLAVATSLAGHSVALQAWRSAAITSDAIHVLAASTWMGGLFALAIAGLSAHVPIKRLVDAFSPVALVATALIVGSGVLSGWLELEQMSALWETPYGQVLVLKVLLFAAAASMGAYNFLRVKPQLADSGVSSPFLGRTIPMELTFGALVLVLTGVLTGLSPH